MSVGRIRDALRFIPADDRDLWVKIGMAVKSELGNDGFDIWNEWSHIQGGDTYNLKDATAVWKSIKLSGRTTILSLYREARYHGWRPAPNSDYTSAPKQPPPAPRNREPEKKALDWSERAEAIWRRTQPLRGTVGEAYLRHRGCVIPPPDSDVRFLHGKDDYPPSLCARVTDILTGRPISLHFTRLAPDGRGKANTGRDKLLLAGHRKAGGIIKVWPDEVVTHGLALAEGIETCCAIAHVHTPTWATVDAGGLATFPVLSGIEALTIYADHDDAGMRAAAQCARRWREAGREVRVIRCRLPRHDAADIAEGEAA